MAGVEREIHAAPVAVDRALRASTPTGARIAQLISVARRSTGATVLPIRLYVDAGPVAHAFARPAREAATEDANPSVAPLAALTTVVRVGVEVAAPPLTTLTALVAVSGRAGFVARGQRLVLVRRHELVLPRLTREEQRGTGQEGESL
jgi:hypothetical protein